MTDEDKKIAVKNMAFPDLLKTYESAIAKALPKHMTVDRFARIGLTAYRQNPKLAQCDALTVFASVMTSAQTGLEIGVLGQAYLVPYYDTRAQKLICQFIPGWQGLVDLVNRAGNASVWTQAVFPGDDFDYAYGDRPFVSHKKGKGVDDPEKMLFAYAVGRVKGGEWPNIEVWPIEKVRAHLNRYNKVGPNHYALAKNGVNWEMYARKVPLLQVIKYMPKSPELTRAVTMGDMGEVGKAKFDGVEEAIEGVFSAMDDDDAGGQQQDGGTGGETKTYPDDEFAASIGAWEKLIVGKKRSHDQIVQMAQSRFPLTEAQRKRIYALGRGDTPPADAGAKAPQDIVDSMLTRARAATLSTAEIMKHLKVDSLDGLTMKQVDAALSFIDNPLGN